MAIHSMSSAAYAAQQLSGNTLHQKNSILLALLLGDDFSLQELKFECAFNDVGTVSARCHDLKKSGHIEEAKRRRCSISQVTINPLVITDLGRAAITVSNSQNSNE